ncbi:MAG: exopolysaccharide biosynthesis protein [Myxococcota bacterium]|nr:exopolysaccharide biosynthesis protein [Myxococcota bacterium]
MDTPSVDSSSRLSRELDQFLESLGGEDSTLGALLDSIAGKGFGLLLMVLALPAALPIPAPGYATPFGLLMVFLGAQMLVGKSHPWLPASLRGKTLKYKTCAFAVRNSGKVLRLVEWLVRPRLSGLARNRVFLSLVSLVIILMASFMILPIPLTNTAPSFVIFLLAAGMLEEDGLVLLGGLILAPLAAFIASMAIYYAVTYGFEAIEPMVKDLLGLQ